MGGYDVFLSYAHVDVRDNPVRQRFLGELKSSIEALSRRPLVFLDSEALQRGETWNSKIRMAIQSCRVFVCLLSESYLKSPYCKREFLLWSQKELRIGRIRKMTMPIYYVAFPGSFDEMSARSRLAAAVLSLQIDLKPWFEVGETALREEQIRERLEGVVRSVGSALDAGAAAEESFCSVRAYNPAFVGRLSELREVWELCNSGQIPVLHAAGGVGKTELAVAFAHGFADEYPKGRFMIRAENATSWAACLRDLTCGAEYDPNKPEMSAGRLLGLGPDEEKLPLEEFAPLVWSALKDRARQGRLLILVDNLNDMSLVGVKGLQDLDPRGIPSNIHILVTTRDTPGNGRYKIAVPFAVGNLDEDTSLELLRNYCPESAFNQDRPDETDDENLAAARIVSLLDGHAWSLEIIGSYVGENWRRGMTFERQLDAMMKDPRVEGVARDGTWMTDEALLQPTLDALEAEPHGDLEMKLLRIAAAFAPDTISVELLAVCYRELVLPKEADASAPPPSFDECADALRRYHLISLDGDADDRPTSGARFARMHRLTRSAVLRKYADVMPELAAAALEAIDRVVFDDDNVCGADRDACVSLCDFAQDALQRTWGASAIRLVLDSVFTSSLLIDFLADRGLALMDAVRSQMDSSAAHGRYSATDRCKALVATSQLWAGLGKMRNAQASMDEAIECLGSLSSAGGSPDDAMDVAFVCIAVMSGLTTCVDVHAKMADKDMLCVDERRIDRCHRILQRIFSTWKASRAMRQAFRFFERYRHFVRARVARLTEKKEVALQEYKKALSFFPASGRQDAADMMLLAQVNGDLAVVCGDLGHPKEAYARAMKTIDIVERMGNPSAMRVIRVQALYTAAEILRNQDQFGNALALLNDAVVLCREMVAEGAPKVQYSGVLIALSEVAVLAGNGDLAEAVSAESGKILLEMKSDRSGVPLECAKGLVLRGDFLFDRGRKQESVRWYEEALEILEVFRKAGCVTYANALLKLAKAQEACDERDQARSTLSQAVDSVKGERGDESRKLHLCAVMRQADFEQRVGDSIRAEGLYGDLYALASRFRRRDESLGLLYMMNATLGQIELLGADELVRRERLERQCAALRSRQAQLDFAKYAAYYVITLNNHAMTLGKLGRTKASSAAFAKGIEVGRRMVVDGLPDVAGSLETLLDNINALADRSRDYHSLAVPIERIGLDLGRRLSVYGEAWRMAQWCLAKLLSAAGKSDSAQAVIEGIMHYGRRRFRNKTGGVSGGMH